MIERVSIAQCRIARAPGILKAYGLGSCLAVCLYDPDQQIGGLGHMLLPNWSEKYPLGSPEKYVDAGIRLMVDQLVGLGGQAAQLVAKITGGANMFETEYQTLINSIGARNAKSARVVLAELGIPIIAEDVGGNQGRTVEFDLATGKLFVYCAHSESKHVL